MIRFHSISSPDKQSNTVRRFFKATLTFIAVDPSVDMQATLSTQQHEISSAKTSRPR